MIRFFSIPFKMFGKKGQSSVELLLVFVSVGFGLVGSLFILNLYAENITDDVLSDNIEVIGRDMIQNAEVIYMLGPPARLKAQYNFPAGVLNMTVDNERELFFKIQLSDHQNYMGFHSSVNISARFVERDFAPGLNTFLFYHNETSDEVIIKRWYNATTRVG